jgi:hypothetical protein
MSLLKGVIPPQSFELVRDKIGAILVDEIENQGELSYSEDLMGVDVWVERFIPFGHAELPVVNIMFVREDFEGRTVKQSDGLCKYHIDCHTQAKSPSANQRGDSLAIVKLHKLLGVCRAILENPQYKTLGFTPPFVMTRYIESIIVGNPDNPSDANSVVMGRITIVVKVPETTELIDPNMIDGNDTVAKLSETDLGYVYKANNDGAFSDEFSDEFD